MQEDLSLFVSNVTHGEKVWESQSRRDKKRVKIKLFSRQGRWETQTCLCAGESHLEPGVVAVRVEAEGEEVRRLGSVALQPGNLRERKKARKGFVSDKFSWHLISDMEEPADRREGDRIN